jgi:transcriptional regulator with GAF, ATPase, and Fis domain
MARKAQEGKRGVELAGVVPGHRLALALGHPATVSSGRLVTRSATVVLVFRSNRGQVACDKTCRQREGRPKLAITEEQAHALSRLTAAALSTDELPETLRKVCCIAASAIPAAEGASITTFPDGRPGAVASDEWSQQFDELQYAEHEGPCLDAFRTGTVFRVRDLAEDTRWPSYVPKAVTYGARSMMSLPLAAEGKNIGALNLYSRQPDAFDSEAVSMATIVAAHAGLASQVAAALFGHRELADQLTEAMRSRAVIEQAKGLLMGSLHCDAEEAFQTLVRLSQTSNRKLREVAAALVADAAKGSAASEG